MLTEDVAFYNQVRSGIKANDLGKIIALLQDSKAKIDIITPFGSWLHMACAHGQYDIADWLITQGIDIDAVGGMGDWRAINEACASGHAKLVELLITAGAIIDVTDSIRNPLFSTIVGGISDSHTAIAKMLIDAGIDTTKRYSNLHNMNALEFANEWGRVDIANLLMAN